MGFTSTPEHEMLRETMQEFASENFYSKAQQLDQTGEILWRLCGQAAQTK